MMKTEFIFYIHSEVFNPENFSDENIQTFAKSMHIVFEIARQLEAKVFYKLGEVQDLKALIADIDYGFTQSQGSRLQLLLQDFIPFKEDYHYFKVHFSDAQTSLESVNYGFLNAMDNQKASYIIFTQTLSGQEQLLLVHASDDFYFCEINNFNVAKDIWTFINKKSKRTYSFSSKHGNSTTTAIPPKATVKASQLRSSDAEAQALLNSAIFDLREKKFYYNFDTDKNTFILFPYEGDNPQNQFHAFHITPEEWHREIPSSIRKYFGK
jgi:hypothetical protein